MLERSVGAGLELDRYINDREAADLLGLSRTYVRQMRLSGDGPRFFNFGRAVRYRLTDLHAWAEARAMTSTSERRAGCGR